MNDPKLFSSLVSFFRCKDNSWPSVKRMGCCWFAQHRAPESLSLETDFHIPGDLKFQSLFSEEYHSPTQSQAGTWGVHSKSHKLTSLGGMVQAVLYLDESTQSCYSWVWAYDYMVLMLCGILRSWELWVPNLLYLALISPCLKLKVKLLNTF